MCNVIKHIVLISLIYGVERSEYVLFNYYIWYLFGLIYKALSTWKQSEYTKINGKVIHSLEIFNSIPFKYIGPNQTFSMSYKKNEMSKSLVHCFSF